MSYLKRNNGSTIGYNINKLKENWNYWVRTGEEVESFQFLKENGKW